MERDLPTLQRGTEAPFYPQAEPEPPLSGSVRAKLFVLVFLVALVIGLLVTFAQPAQYRSSATVLMSAPVAIDNDEQEANIQSVAIQRRVLLGGEVTQHLSESLTEAGHDAVDTAYLRRVLSVEPVPETNLVEMTARGTDGDILPALVNNWIDVYLEVRAVGIQESQQQTLRLVRDQLAGLEVKLEEARLALAQYREEHEITSAERQENEVMARLDGLNKALNNALEAEVQSRAKLQASRRAIAQGERIAPPNESERVEAMDAELAKLKQQLARITKTYTLSYVRREPRYRNIPEKIDQLESDLDKIYAKGEAKQLAKLRREYETAGKTAEELQARLDAHEKDAAQFTTIYATHQALVEDLARLEDLNRDAQARLIGVQVNPVDKYPQVSVIDRPAPDSERTGPDYRLWLGGSVLAALVLGVLSVWLYGFLAPRRNQPAFVTLSGVHMYPQDINGQLGYSTAPNPQLAQDANKLLGTGQSEADASADPRADSDLTNPPDEPPTGNTPEK
ncbi:MAG: hypothetical protein Hals2KO_26730 [Halioglobus sp.]